MKTPPLLTAALVGVLALITSARAHAADKKPNIVVIWGDDIGYWNVSAYNQGMMGYKTPKHRPHCQGRRAVHRLVWPAKLHSPPRQFRLATLDQFIRR